MWHSGADCHIIPSLDWSEVSWAIPKDLEEVYMWQVKGMKEYFRERPEMAWKYDWAEDKVMRVIRPLYGLKQSGRNWQLRFRRKMKALGFEPLVADSAVYRHAATRTLVLSYVEYLLVIVAKDEQFNFLKEGRAGGAKCRG